jgi:hypothetical protein
MYLWILLGPLDRDTNYHLKHIDKLLYDSFIQLDVLDTTGASSVA